MGGRPSSEALSSSTYFDVLGDGSFVVGSGIKEVDIAWWKNKDISIFRVKHPGNGNLYVKDVAFHSGGLKEIQKNA